MLTTMREMEIMTEMIGTIIKGTMSIYTSIRMTTTNDKEDFKAEENSLKLGKPIVSTRLVLYIPK